jgi:glycosyltransferase involved in cell wall biosynthesis
MRVSVVTVCRNAEASIAATLASVAAQTYPDVEHVIIDGASSDGTMRLVREHGRNVRGVSEPDRGIYDAMQKGVALASGEVLFFLNSGDTFADARVVAEAVAFLGATGADAVFGDLLPVAGSTSDHAGYRPGRRLDQGFLANRQLLFDHSIHHQSIFYRRRVFDGCGFLGEDSRADGEYRLNLCAFVCRGLSARYWPRLVARFPLGGHSTADYAAEWQRFTVARELLRRQYFPHGQGSTASREYLHFPPSLKNRLKLLAHRPALRPVLAAIRRLRGRPDPGTPPV